MCTSLHGKSSRYLWKYDLFSYLFCPNVDTKFREAYHSNHVIPRLELTHRDLYKSLKNDLFPQTGVYFSLRTTKKSFSLLLSHKAEDPRWYVLSQVYSAKYI